MGQYFFQKYLIKLYRCCFIFEDIITSLTIRTKKGDRKKSSLIFIGEATFLNPTHEIDYSVVHKTLSS